MRAQVPAPFPPYLVSSGANSTRHSKTPRARRGVWPSKCEEEGSAAPQRAAARVVGEASKFTASMTVVPIMVATEMR